MEICESAFKDNITYVVELTGLLNENCCGIGDGRYDGGGSNWKFKHERIFVVKDCKSAREALAFVVALGMENSLVLKEWPHSVMSEEEWLWEINNHEESALAEGFNAPWGGVERIVDMARHVSPKDVNASKAEMAAKTRKYGM